ncbi:hypothetical protein D0839_17310 [Bordetella avium]|uniref:hypothetical protein n=1 Tax=Bordetella avium TaxID=521 RepID=UPI000E67D40F|nr:hypothetical protein [Bordetella avium]RIQ64647.1 hypothetical protein D0839_17310 [Bordetella avium]UOK17466.1 hypothetical protein vBBaMIFTN8_01 [Bordetella phage vB_BaM-IFTN8]
MDSLSLVGVASEMHFDLFDDGIDLPTEEIEALWHTAADRAQMKIEGDDLPIVLVYMALANFSDAMAERLGRPVGEEDCTFEWADDLPTFSRGCTDLLVFVAKSMARMTGALDQISAATQTIH